MAYHSWSTSCRVLTVAAAAALFTTASAWGPAPESTALPDITWSPCVDDTALDCATIPVPLDHAYPDGAKIDVALARAPATDPDARLGSLVLHRGGPGYGSGEYLRLIRAGAVAAPVTDEVMARYDLVTVDQRGTGESRPAVACFDSPEDAAAFGAGLSLYPTTEAERVDRLDRDRRYVDRCQERSGELLEHLDTPSAARDLDLVRSALGEERLNFLGQSYGAHLGTVYAHLFPERVGRTVLDSVLGSEAQSGKPTEPLRSARIGSDVEADAAFQQFAARCTAEEFPCDFGAGDPVGAFDRLQAELAAEPVELITEDGRAATLTDSYLPKVTAAFLYQPTIWPSVLAPILTAVEEAVADPTSESGRFIAADLVDGSGALLTPYGDIRDPYHAVTCTDGIHPASPSAFVDAVEDRRTHSPRFAETRAWEDSVCSVWPVGADDRFDGPWGTDTATPVLLISNRLDPATPLAGAERAAELLTDSRLLVNEGPGHIASQQSGCIVERAGEYLMSGTLPAEGAVCEPDPLP
ncbi:pimeloyl-ACP methyl ester carboxylesterase [Actinoalloteichus hoggarensis]|uniref:Tripeptidyl aminopeptidase n=1 Tax=Actinoalloteichus hoggarensis TaxID=1470176 RepID=A0A221VXC7_9PSEU|nr:alpha/beta hydrolase [Actinoalloteichus hoggarensis]ASO18196.1 Tripeptidyl aminopeptidase precursor [Actinoalloteichus hoggarensis]MBB5921554.1 pimeloyl-ACP methyl ester carboxylesterase [Actinoalloteichus hoggarensis]